VVAARHPAENTHHRIGQIHTEKVLLRCHRGERVAKRRARRQLQRFYDAVLRLCVDDLNADHGS
jgi:hypothetical protein